MIAPPQEKCCEKCWTVDIETQTVDDTQCLNSGCSCHTLDTIIKKAHKLDPKAILKSAQELKDAEDALNL